MSNQPDTFKRDNGSQRRRSSLSDDIAQRLTTGILAGRFRFGERLPPERELARFWNVGRPTVREAIKTLSVVGLVDVRSGEGTYVIDGHGEFVAKLAAWAVLLDARSARATIEARIAIESETARLAARRAPSESIAKLREIVDRMERFEKQPARFTAADLEFHVEVASAAGNETLSRVLNAIQSLLRQWIRGALQQPGTSTTALAQHRAILAAIEDGDEDEAAARMRHHLTAMGEVLAVTLSAQHGLAAKGSDALR